MNCFINLCSCKNTILCIRLIDTRTERKYPNMMDFIWFSEPLAFEFFGTWFGQCSLKSVYFSGIHTQIKECTGMRKCILLVILNVHKFFFLLFLWDKKKKLFGCLWCILGGCVYSKLETAVYVCWNIQIIRTVFQIQVKLSDAHCIKE